MWGYLAGSVLLIGLTLAVTYKVYSRIKHPTLIVEARKNVPEFVQDSFAQLVQGPLLLNFLCHNYLMEPHSSAISLHKAQLQPLYCFILALFNRKKCDFKLRLPE